MTGPGIVWLRRSVLDTVDRARGRKSRSEFIAQAVAHELGRQAAGGGVISAPASGEPKFTPRGLLGGRGIVPPGKPDDDGMITERRWGG